MTGPPPRRVRGFAILSLLFRLMLAALVCVGAAAILTHKQAVGGFAASVPGRVQALLPMGPRGQEADLVEAGYRLLKEDSLVSLYGAVQVFGRASGLSEHDVAARAAEADAQVALAHAYGASSDMMARYTKTLHGPGRKEAERLVSKERKEAQRHVRAAQQFAKEALRLSPVAFVAQRAMAAALLEGGRTERARPYLAQAKAARPQDHQVLLMLADQDAHKEPRSAVVVLQTILAQAPEFNSARFRLALLHWQLDDRAAARQDLLTVLAASPGHVLARRLLAELEPLAHDGPQMAQLTSLPREEDVLPSLPDLGPAAPSKREQTSSENPAPQGAGPLLGDDPAAQLQLYVHTGLEHAAWAASWLAAQLQRAKATSAQAIEGMLEEQAPSVQTAKAPAEMAVPSAAPGALASQTPGVSSPPAPQVPAGAAPGASAEPYQALVVRAKTREQARDRAAAQSLWLEALALRPTSVEALTALGWIALQAHDSGQASTYFGQAAALAPNSGEAQFGLAEAKRVQHDVAGAKAAYNRYLALEPDGPLSPLCHRMLEELGPER